MEVIQSRNAVQPIQATWRDYLHLTKPVTTLMLQIPALASLFIASGQRGPDLSVLLATMAGGYLAAAGANALNSLYDTDTDSLMYHTRNRPLPAQRIDPGSARKFGITLCALGFVLMTVWANVLAGMLLLTGALYYVIIYTQFLKMRTVHNSLFSGVAWAFPALVGWAASGSFSAMAFILFGIIIYWAPVLYLSRGIAYKRDFTRAGVPYLPVVRGDRPARSQVLIFSILMVLMSIAPVALSLLYSYYGIAALSCGGLFLILALLASQNPGSKPARDLARYAQIYFVLLFAAMILDRIVFISR